MSKDSATRSSFLQKHSVRSWSTMPEVLVSGLLQSLSRRDVARQEARFEVLTTEASYFSKLRVLELLYMKNIRLGNIITEDDYRTLFGKVEMMIESSDRLLKDLERHWSEDILLDNLTGIMYHHLLEENTFKNFLEYSRHYPQVVKCLKILLAGDGIFKHCVETLKNHVHAQRLSIQSYLILPLQRVSRLVLLLKAVLSCLDEEHEDYDRTLQLLNVFKKMAEECNTEMESAENKEVMSELSRQLWTPPDMRPVVIRKDSRMFLSRTRVLRVHQDSGKRERMEVFLFNDLLVIAKEQKGVSDQRMTVADYCRLDCLVSNTVVAGASNSSSSDRPEECPEDVENTLHLTLLSNHKEEQVDMVLQFSDSERDVWLHTLRLAQSGDLPQYLVHKAYTATRKSDLCLFIGDVLVDVREAPVHGYMQGRKLIGGDTGWFPETCVIRMNANQIRRHSMALTTNRPITMEEEEEGFVIINGFSERLV